MIGMYFTLIKCSGNFKIVKTVFILPNKCSLFSCLRHSSLFLQFLTLWFVFIV